MRYALVEGYLELANISIDDICEDLKITKRTFYNKIKGSSDFSLNEATIISQRIGRRIDEIFLIKDV